MEIIYLLILVAIPAGLALWVAVLKDKEQTRQKLKETQRKIVKTESLMIIYDRDEICKEELRKKREELR